MEAPEVLTVGGVGAAIGGVIGWVINQIKASAEIKNLQTETDKLVKETEKLVAEKDKMEKEVEKLQIETVKLQADVTKNEGELLLNVQTARKNANDAYLECGKCMDKLIDRIKTNASDAEVDSARDE